MMNLTWTQTSTLKMMMSNYNVWTELINNDDCLRDLVNVLADTNGYQDYPHLRKMLLQKIELALGNRLKFKEVGSICIE